MRPEPLLRLAVGELTPNEIVDLEALKRQIQRRSGLICGGYKDRCFRRRVAVRMRARGVTDYATYAALLETDPGEYDRFLAALTINVSKFYRNAPVWDALRASVIPALVDAGLARIRVWSAGAAAGEEAYTLAMIVLEEAERRQQPELRSRFELVATDVDPGVVAIAREARFPAASLAETPDAARRRWFTPDAGRFRLRDEVRGMVRFQVADLLAAASPPQQHLVLCRNVMIYFEREQQERLLTLLRDTLVPGGFLVLGQVETLVGVAAGAFRVVAARERIYQKRS